MAAQEVPWPRPVVEASPVQTWDFGAEVRPSPAEDWRLVNAVGGADEGFLRIDSAGEDPYLIGPVFEALSGEFLVRVVSTSTIPGTNAIYWSTAATPGFAESRRADDTQGVLRIEDGCAVREIVLGQVEGLSQIRLDPGSGPGTARLKRLELVALRRADLWCESLRSWTGDGGSGARVALRNSGKDYLPLLGEEFPLAPGGLREISFSQDEGGMFAEFRLDEFLPEPARRAIHPHAFGSGHIDLHEPTDLAGDLVARALPDGLWLRRGGLRLEAARDGLGAVLHDGREVHAILHPIALHDGLAVRFRCRTDGDVLHLESESVNGSIRLLDGSQVDVHLTATGAGDIEGPVVRTAEPHLRAVLPGVEFLSRREPSSSDRDCETAARLRFAPDPRWITWPFAAIETRVDLGLIRTNSPIPSRTLAVAWRPAILQPVFSAPDRYDGRAGARFALRGRAIHARLDLGAKDLDDAILRGVRALRLPDPPDDGLGALAWKDLCRTALTGPLSDPAQGWGHCAEPRWPRQPYVDFASALWRLDGTCPPLPGDRPQVPGGAHLHDDAACLVGLNPLLWMRHLRAEAVRLIGEQQDDGQYEYSGPYLRGHFEHDPYASGYGGERAARLLEIARVLGDDSALEAGLRALRALDRHHTPRGAQTWELSLHTPDILAAAHLVRAHVQAFELTDDPKHLQKARLWATRGLPFVYLRKDRDVMPYATIAVFGATNWQAPVWFGQPVQWCGLVYADALARLAAHDDDPLWRQVATGILAAGRAMQYRDGPLAGCLPDLWLLPDRADGGDGIGGGPSINPIALLHLDARLRGQPWQIHTARREVDPGARGFHVATPYPVDWNRKLETFVVRKPDDGSYYSYVVDGTRTGRTNARLIRPDD